MNRENSYEYAANVKDKVKRLEAKANKSPGQNPVSNIGVRPPPTKDQANKAELNNSSETLNSSAKSSAAAVMDVEITQLNSPHSPPAVPKVSVNGSNFESDSDTDIDPPISVKSLLRRFSAGMTHTFRKKSPDSENGESSNKAGVAPNSLLVPRGVVDLDDSLEKNPPSEGIGIPRSKSVSHKQKPTNVVIKKSAQNTANVPNKDAEILKTNAPATIQSRGSTTTTPKVSITKKTPSSTEGTQSSFALSKLLHFQRSSKKQNESEQQEDDPGSKVPHNKIIQNGITDSTTVNGHKLQDSSSTNEELKPFPPKGTGAPVVIPFENETSAKSVMQNEKEVTNNSNSQVIPKPKPRVVKQPVEDKLQQEKVPRDSLTMHTEIILVVGPSRAGKSSIVNHILHQDLSTIYKSRPSEREIVECIANNKSKTGSHHQEELLSTLVLIDTPGFTGEKMGAAMWSTLLQHLDKSSTPLDAKPPSMILVVVSEAETGSFVESDEFQNFCKALSHYCTNSFMGFPTILFVVTYSAPLDIAASRLAIERLSNLARPYFPIRVCFHKIMHTKEKDSSSNVLTSTRPDLLTGLRSFCTNDDKDDSTVTTTVTTKHHETHRHPVLKHVFATNYPKTISECFVSKRISLKSLEHPDTLKTYKILQNLYQNVIIEPTEISTLLEIGWENVNSSLRKKYPSSLLVIQQVMQKCKIRTFSDLPEDPMNTFQLLKHIPQHNPAIADLLIETLQLKVPSCYAALYIGQGYDVSKDAVTHVSPFQLSGALKTSPVGLIPNEISCKITEDREIIFKFFCTLEEYALDRFKDLGIKHVTFPKSGPPVTLTANQKIGYNIVKPNQEPTKTTTATSNVEYRAFQLSLARGEEIEFKQQFWDTISSLPELNIKDAETVDCWSEFFKYWGTHIVKAAHAGGSVQVTFRGKILSKIFKSIYQKSEILTDELETSRVFQWLTGDGLDFARPQNAKTEFMQGCDVDTSFHGGDMRFQQTDLTKLDHDKVSSTREEWIQSLSGNPLILETNLVLVPISYFVRQKSEGIATKMDVAFLHFYSNFIGSQAKQSNCSIL